MKCALSHSGSPPKDAGIAAQILRDTLMRMASWVELRASTEDEVYG
jgi:hypothetical protein